MLGSMIICLLKVEKTKFLTAENLVRNFIKTRMHPVVESTMQTVYECCEWVADLFGVTSPRYEVYMDDDMTMTKDESLPIANTTNPNQPIPIREMINA